MAFPSPRDTQRHLRESLVKPSLRRRIHLRALCQLGCNRRCSLRTLYTFEAPNVRTLAHLLRRQEASLPTIGLG